MKPSPKFGCTFGVFGIFSGSIFVHGKLTNTLINLCLHFASCSGLFLDGYSVFIFALNVIRQLKRRLPRQFLRDDPKVLLQALKQWLPNQHSGNAQVLHQVEPRQFKRRISSKRLPSQERPRLAPPFLHPHRHLHPSDSAARLQRSPGRWRTSRRSVVGYPVLVSKFCIYIAKISEK